ncbi:MAG: hypothetical protein GC193_04435 [Cryomorphaceae bacterium]|nr:hypothetical protein [Cryomorphaceae bacterium]
MQTIFTNSNSQVFGLRIWMTSLAACMFTGFSSLGVSAQTFTNVADGLGIVAVVNGGNFDMAGCSFADFNNDGFDDITFGLNGFAPKFYLNQGDGTFQNVTIVMQSISNCKGIMWVDYDNDGDRDLYISNESGANRLLRNDGDFTFTNVSASSGLMLNGSANYGASWGDYDLDGDLDVYICNYMFVDGPNTDAERNHLFRNDGNDLFTNVTSQAGFDPLSELSFQPIWYDYDHDLYPDLFLTNDKQFQNRMFHNNGDGTFSEVSDDTGFGINVDSMSASFGDFNNDLILDFYTTNLPDGNVLLQGNSDFTYTDVTEQYGLLVNDFTWGAAWFDMDNDSDLDIYLAEAQAGSFNSPNYLFRNLGPDFGYIFEDALDSLISPDITNAYSVASGDLDSDGNVDLIVNNRAPNNAYVWKNNGNANGNGYIKVGLEGTISNIDGIGSYITVWFDGNARVTYTMLGEQFLSQNSFTEHFGIGQNTVVDSVIVKWPSGIIDHYYDITSGTTLHAVEGDSATPEVITQYNPCTNEPAHVTLIGSNIVSIAWNTGSTETSIDVSTSGTYTANVLLASGNTIDLIQEINLSPPPNIISNITSPLCADSLGGSIELINSTGISLESILWIENNETEPILTNIGAGTYTYEVVDLNGCTSSGSVTVESPNQLSANVNTQNGNCPGDLGIANIVVSGGTQPYSIDWNFQDPLQLSNGEYNVVISDSNGCLKETEFEINNPPNWDIDLLLVDAFNGDNGHATLSVEGGTPPYLVLWSNGSQEMGIFNLPQGNYFFVVQDSNGCFSQEDFEIIDLHVPKANDRILVSALGDAIYRFSGIEIEDVKVYDSLGRLVFSSKNIGWQCQVDLRSFNTGQYVVLINNEMSLKVIR